MQNAADHYLHMSDHELNAAERAATLNERISHLENAFEYAKLASAERKRSNVYEFSSHRR